MFRYGHGVLHEGQNIVLIEIQVLHFIRHVVSSHWFHILALNTCTESVSTKMSSTILFGKALRFDAKQMSLLKRVLFQVVSEALSFTPWSCASMKLVFGPMTIPVFAACLLLLPHLNPSNKNSITVSSLSFFFQGKFALSLSWNLPNVVSALTSNCFSSCL